MTLTAEAVKAKLDNWRHVERWSGGSRHWSLTHNCTKGLYGVYVALDGGQANLSFTEYNLQRAIDLCNTVEEGNTPLTIRKAKGWPGAMKFEA